MTLLRVKNVASSEAGVKQFRKEEAEGKRADSMRPPEANSSLVVFWHLMQQIMSMGAFSIVAI